jgi:hypothetical protein
VCSLCVRVSARESDGEEKDMGKGQHTSVCPHSFSEREREGEREGPTCEERARREESVTA